MPLCDDKAFARAIAILLADSKTIEEAREKFMQLYKEDVVIVRILGKQADSTQ